MKTRKYFSALKLLLLSCLFIIYCSISAQDGWQRSYQIGQEAEAYDVIQTADGGFVATGKTRLADDNDTSDVLLMKVDINGALLWWQTFGNENRNHGNAVLETTAGELVIAGRTVTAINDIITVSAIVLKTNATGNIIWEQTYAGSEAYDMVESGDGGYIFINITTNEDGNSETNLNKIDSDGNIVWSKKIAIPTKDVQGFDIERTSEGGYLVIGREGNPGNQTFIAKTDVNGDQESYSTYPVGTFAPPNQGGATVKQITGDDIIGMGTSPTIEGPFTTVYKATLASEELDWNIPTPAPFGPLFSSGDGRDLLIDFDGNIVITGNQNIDGQGTYLKKVDINTGEEIWFETYELIESSYSFSNTLAKTNDNGFIFGGASYENVQQVLLIKTDGLGIVPHHLVEGHITNDINDSCNNENEDALAGWIVSATDGTNTFYGSTDSTGYYAIKLDTGDYVISLNPFNNYWEACDNDIPIDLTSFYDSTTVDFNVQASFDCPLMTVDLSTPFLRRCFENTYYVNYCNQGTATATATTVIVELSPLINYISSTATLLSQSDNIYTFDIGDVDALACGNFNILVEVDCDSTELGQVLCTQAHIFPDTICSDAPTDWDGSSISTSVECDTDSIIFSIINTGLSDMSEALQYVIIEDHVIMFQGNFQLNSGEIQTSKFPAMAGSIYMIQAEQAANHPIFTDISSLGISGCNTEGIDIVFSPLEYPENDGAPAISIDCQELIGSYDPNDKQGFPRGYGEENFIEKNTDIEYLIRFQNTGNDTAFKVVIVDTLSEFLDPISFKAGASSHPYSYKISGEGIIEFSFDNIMLPDSNANLAASNGFVKFRIAQQRDNPLGTIINNEAAIYFDFNDPVITNQTKHTIGENFIEVVVNTINPLLPQVSMKVYPNPFVDIATFAIEGADFNNLRLSLYDLTGKLIRRESYENARFQFSRKQLLSGMYIYKIEGDGQLISSGKLLIQ